MNRLIFLILSAALVAGAGRAGAGQTWNNRVWSSDDGLMDNRIVSVKQSSDGLLWVATAKDVVRFDGLEFKPLTVSVEAASVGKIQALFIDSLDRLWIVKAKGEIVCVDGGKVVMSIPSSTGKQNPGSPSIVEEKAGVVLFCFPNGEFLRVHDGKSEPVTKEGSVLGENRLVVRDGLGQIWFSQGSRGFGIIKEGRLSILETLRVNCLAGAHSGGVWICSGNELWRYTEAGSLQKICSLPGDLVNVNPRAFHEDRRGCLWVGSHDAGLFRFDGTSFTKISSLYPRISSVDEDMEGNIWVGTPDGLNQLKPAVVTFLGSGDDVFYGNAMSITEDRDNFLWVVWITGRITKSPVSRLMESATFGSNSTTEEKNIRSAQCVLADPSGGLWFGTEDSGVCKWQNGVVTTNLTIANGLPGSFVTALHMTQDGTLWFGASTESKDRCGLVRWKSGSVQSYSLPADSRAITAITSDTNGCCWIATYGGYLLRVDSNGVLIDETGCMGQGRYTIYSLCLTPDGSLWIGFSGKGLGRLKNGRFRVYRMEQGLNENSIARIRFDGFDRLWFAGDKGLFCVRFEDFDDVDAGRSRLVQSVVYGKNEGLLNLRATGFFWPGDIRDTAGRLLFGMQGGIAVINPLKSGNILSPPPVIIDRVELDGRTIADYGEGGDIFPDPAQPVPVDLRQNIQARLRIPPGSSHLEISFLAPSYKLPECTLFRCRLLGLSSEWSEMGAQRSISYYGIRHGDYQFQVIARNSDGVWSKTGASLALTIEAYWWETVWFRVGGPLAAAGLLLTGIIIFLRRRQKLQIERLELLQATEKERSRIAADLHDEMGSNLTQIGLLCEKAGNDLSHPAMAKDHLDKAVANSHMLSQQLDAVVWAVNPANDTLEGFIEYLSDYAQRFLMLADIRLRMAVPEELPPVSFPSASRHQLFLAVKEALHNVVKHAAATLVTLRIRLESGEVVVEVEDDGKGIDRTRNDSVGADGLGNMARRMERLKGRCEYRPGKDGRGTLLLFAMPLGLTEV